MTFHVSVARTPNSAFPASRTKPCSTPRSAPASKSPSPAARASAAPARAGHRRRGARLRRRCAGRRRARRGPGAVLQRAAAFRPRHRAALDQQGRSVRAQDRRRAGVPPAKARRRRHAGASALSRRHPRQVQGRPAPQPHSRQRRAPRFLDGQSAARERRRATAHPPCAGRRVHQLCVREAQARRPAEAGNPVRRFHLARQRQADPVRRRLDRLRADQVDHRGHVHQEHPARHDAVLGRADARRALFRSAARNGRRKIRTSNMCR